jgi:hypothetical protein
MSGGYAGTAHSQPLPAHRKLDAKPSAREPINVSGLASLEVLYAA